jgi:hypothetical protein
LDRNECKQEAREVQVLKITDERMHFDYVWGTMYLPWQFFLDLTLYHVVDIPVLYNNFFLNLSKQRAFIFIDKHPFMNQTMDVINLPTYVEIYAHIVVIFFYASV